MATDIVLTFDNLGEALEIERGEWDGSVALGRHRSVTEALPRLLETLRTHRLSATFCIEAINCGLNPGAVRAIVDSGHEVAAHAFRHEVWDELGDDPAHEDAQLRRCRTAFAELGVQPVGFRPPGGELTPATPGLLAANGFRWGSPLHNPAPPPTNGIAWLPFRWELVDAYYLLEHFAAARTGKALPAEPMTSDETARRLRAELAGRGPHVVILHPFVMLEPGWADEVDALLSELARRARAGEVRVLTAAQAARAPR